MSTRNESLLVQSFLQFGQTAQQLQQMWIISPNSEMHEQTRTETNMYPGHLTLTKIIGGFENTQ
jgi:hypothetical protein